MTRQPGFLNTPWDISRTLDWTCRAYPRPPPAWRLCAPPRSTRQRAPHGAAHLLILLPGGDQVLVEPLDGVAEGPMFGFSGRA